MRVSSVSAFLVSIALMVQASAAPAQQRPGIRTFVNPPEGCFISDPVEPENIYSFLRVQIQALSLAQLGERANSVMLETKGGAPVDQMAKAIAGLREERIHNDCASFVVSYYTGSENETIATTAKFLVYAYDELGKMSDQMLGISLQKSLRRVNGPSPQLQLSRLMDTRRETFKGMTDAVNLSLALLVDEGRTNTEGKPDHLILRKAQIAELLDYLYARFPSLKDNNGVARSGDFLKQAALIHAFLSGGYRPADLP
jgi:hypothetical protein